MHSLEVGTMAFMPPEAFGGERVIHGRPADIWAAGCTMYMLLSGKLPFGARGSTISELQKNITSSNRRFISKLKVSKNCKSALRAMLERDPEKRITLQYLRAHPYFNMDAKARYTLTTSQKEKISVSEEDMETTIKKGKLRRLRARLSRIRLSARLSMSKIGKKRSEVQKGCFGWCCNGRNSADVEEHTKPKTETGVPEKKDLLGIKE